MRLQLRRYRIASTAMDSWIEEWRRHVVPTRQAAGFAVIGGWVIEETDEFVWIIGYAGPRSFEEADAAYYASPERTSITPDPARHIVDGRQDFIRAALR